MTLLLALLGATASAVVAVVAARLADHGAGDDDAATGVHRATVAAIAAVAGAVVAIRLEATDRLAGLPAWLFLAGAGAALAVVDLRRHRLPDRVVLPAYPVLAVLLTAGAAVGDEWPALLRAALGGAALYAAYFSLALLNPRGLGFGDVKLAGLLGAALGFLSWSTWILGAVAGFWVGAIGGLVVLLRRGRGASVAFGPSMLLGALLAASIQVDRLGLGPR